MQNTVSSSEAKSSLIRVADHRSLKSIVADVVLVGLVSGPVAAPFLAASGLPLLPLIADIIYFMGVHVCPQPEMSLSLLPTHLMAVCMRCYGTLMGVVTMRWLYGRQQVWAQKNEHRNGQGSEPIMAAYWLNQYGALGLGLTLLLCLMYPAELYAQIWGWWDYSNWVVFPFGLVSGLGLGAYIMPLLHQKKQD